MPVLLLGSKTDKHLDAIEYQLKQLQHEAVRIDIYQDISDFAFYYDERSINLRYRDKSITDFNSIYWRHNQENLFPNKQYSLEYLYKQQEVINFFWGMSALNSIHWFNPIFAACKMENKPLQMALASEVGLKIPKTLITGNSDCIKEIMGNEPSKLIEKAIGMAWAEDGTPTYTAAFDFNKLRMSAVYPTIIQHRIQRETELRIYIINEQVIPVEIQVAKSHKAILDWKSIDLHARGYSDYNNLSESLQNKLLSYHLKSGLVYAAYDYIVDEDDCYFLECNPSGNWLFLPDEIATKITLTICHDLIKEH